MYSSKVVAPPPPPKQTSSGNDAAQRTLFPVTIAELEEAARQIRNTQLTEQRFASVIERQNKVCKSIGNSTDMDLSGLSESIKRVSVFGNKLPRETITITESIQRFDALLLEVSLTSISNEQLKEKIKKFRNDDIIDEPCLIDFTVLRNEIIALLLDV